MRKVRGRINRIHRALYGKDHADHTPPRQTDSYTKLAESLEALQRSFASTGVSMEAFANGLREFGDTLRQRIPQERDRERAEQDGGRLAEIMRLIGANAGPSRMDMARVMQAETRSGRFSSGEMQWPRHMQYTEEERAQRRAERDALLGPEPGSMRRVATEYLAQSRESDRLMDSMRMAFSDRMAQDMAFFVNTEGAVSLRGLRHRYGVADELVARPEGYISPHNLPTVEEAAIPRTSPVTNPRANQPPHPGANIRGFRRGT